MTDKEERANANGAQEAQNDTSESARKMMREAGGMLALHGAMSALSFYYSFFDSEHYAQISDSMKRLRAIITDHWDEIWAIASLPDDIREIAPYIAEELRGLIGERKDAGDYEDKTIPELLAQGYDDQGNPTDGLFAQALERARARAEQDEARRVEQERAEQEKAEQEKKQANAERKRAIDSRRAKATEMGALVEPSPLMAIPGDEEYLSVFHTTSLYILSNSSTLSFNKNGKLELLGINNQDFLKSKETDPAVFYYILYTVLKTYNTANQENNDVTIYLPRFFSDTGIDPRPYSQKRQEQAIENYSSTELSDYRLKKLMNLLAPYELYVGRFSDGDIYRFMTFSKYDKESETVQIHTPYLFEIARRVDKDRYKFLIKPEIVNEHNKAAVEIVFWIVQGLIRRGVTTPDKGRSTFTYHVSYKTIINECPLIQKRLEDTLVRDEDGNLKHNANKHYNKVLSDTFSAVFRILEKKTDIYRYFNKLKLLSVYKDGTIMLPTKSRLKDEIKFQYSGKNPEYGE